MTRDLAGILAASRARQARRAAVLAASGSDIYEWEPGVIAAGAVDYCVIDLQFPQARKYRPMDWVRISNKDSVDLKAWINGTSPVDVPAGSIIEIDDFPAVWNLTLENLDSATATTAGKISIGFRKQPMTADKLARERVLL